MLMLTYRMQRQRNLQDGQNTLTVSAIWGISFDGAYDVLGAGMTPDEILAIIIARTADAAIKFTTDGATGAVGWTGNATVQNFSLVGNKETTATFSGSLKGNGALAPIA